MNVSRFALACAVYALLVSNVLAQEESTSESIRSICDGAHSLATLADFQELPQPLGAPAIDGAHSLATLAYFQDPPQPPGAPVIDEPCVCCDCFSACCSRKPRIYGQAEAVFFRRDNNTGDQVVAVDTNRPLGDDTALTTGDLDFDYESGFRVLVGYELDPCCFCSALEFSYLGIFDADASATVTGDNNLALPGDLGLAAIDFFNADAMRVDYRSDLYSFELNCVKTYCGCRGTLDLLAGVRYLSLDETLAIRANDFDTDRSVYPIRTTNDLYGGQIGARFRHYRRWFGWELTGKAGVYNNHARQTQSVDDFDTLFALPFVLRTERSTSRSKAAFVGELGASVLVQLTPCWAARGGYNLIWIEGVALAPNQLDFTDTLTSGTTLQHGAGIVLHGASVGLEARW